MSNYIKQSLVNTAKLWPKSHLDDYIKNLEEQVHQIKELLYELRLLQKQKQKEIDKKLRDSGPRGST